MTHPVVIKIKGEEDLILRAGRIKVEEFYGQIELSLTFDRDHMCEMPKKAGDTAEIYFQLDGQSHVASQCLLILSERLEDLEAYRFDYIVNTIVPDDKYAFLPKNASKEDVAKQILLEKVIVQ